MDGGRDGTRTRDPELAPIFLVRRHTPAFCAVRALSKLGFGKKSDKLSIPAQVFQPKYVYILSVITVTPKTKQICMPKKSIFKLLLEKNRKLSGNIYVTDTR